MTVIEILAYATSLSIVGFLLYMLFKPSKVTLHEGDLEITGNLKVQGNVVAYSPATEQSETVSHKANRKNKELDIG